MKRKMACLFVMWAFIGCGAEDKPTGKTGNRSSVPGTDQHDDSSTPESKKESKNMVDDTLGMPKPKRVAPPSVDPVTIGNLRFESITWGKSRGLGQNGGYIAAFDVGSDEELWTLEVYDIQYDLKMEEDVQDVFITSMTKSSSADELEISDERGRQYIVDIQTRKVRPGEPDKTNP